MTLPASGTITLGQVATELGVGLPISLGDANVRALAGVPSGAISLTNLYGKSAGGVKNPFVTTGAGASVTGSKVVGGVAASAGLQLNTDGTITTPYEVSGGPTNIDSAWYSPTGGTPGNNYWVSRTLVSGTLSNDPGAGWLPLSTARLYRVSKATVPAGAKSCTLTLSISTNASGSPVLYTSQNIVLSATVGI